MSAAAPPFLTDLAEQLRRRGFVLGPEDLDALRQALGAGFGWSSRRALESLCVTLWAKSAREAEVVRAAFQRVDVPELDLPEPDGAQSGDGDDRASRPDQPSREGDEAPSTADPIAAGGTAAAMATADRLNGVPPLPAPPFTGLDRRLVLVPRHPLTEREIAQAWRRVRQPVRVGPAVEVDTDATVLRRSRSGVAAPPVLVARRRNALRMLVFVDADGSMRPYEGFVEYVRTAMEETARFETVQVRYFHNVPGPSADRLLLDTLTDPFTGGVDEILTRIRPLADGRVYTGRALTGPERLADLLDGIAGPDGTGAPGAVGAVVIGDAGAARGRYDPVRLVDTVAFLKALRERCGRPVWLNPTPARRWAGSTAGALSRHVPMFPLASKAGLDAAVGVLRGRSFPLEAPL